MSTVVDSEKGLWLIGRLSENLISRNLRFGTAESCTGGLAASLCTNIPGSSQWFCGAVVAYANHVKTGLLGVEEAVLQKFGAVSGPVVEAMARGALAALGVDVALAISGVAGPDGGTADKPVGTVWFATALALPENAEVRVQSFSRHIRGDRYDVRFGAAMTGLGAVEALLS